MDNVVTESPFVTSDASHSEYVRLNAAWNIRLGSFSELLEAKTTICSNMSDGSEEWETALTH